MTVRKSILVVNNSANCLRDSNKSSSLKRKMSNLNVAVQVAAVRILYELNKSKNKQRKKKSSLKRLYWANIDNTNLRHKVPKQNIFI